MPSRRDDLMFDPSALVTPSARLPMTPNLPRRRFLIGSLATAAVGAAPPRSEAYMGCYVGVAAPLSGPLAVFGEQLRRGADLAIKDLKEKGMRVELFVADDGCQPDRAVQAANKFQADKVVCVFGHYCSAASFAASGFYERAKIVQIIPAPVGFGADAAGQKFVFRILPRPEVEADIAGRVLANRYKGKKVAIAHSDAPGAKRHADVIKQSMSKQGLNAALDETYSLGASDFAPLAEKLRANGIDAFYVAGPSLEAARIVRQVRQVGMATQMVSGSILSAGEFGRVSAGTGEGTLMISSIDVRDLPEAKAVVAAFKKNDYEAEGYTLYAYAAVQTWAQAVQKVGTDDPTRVADTLRGGHTADTVVGKVSFDDKGDIKNPPLALYAFREGSFRKIEDVRL